MSTVIKFFKWLWEGLVNFFTWFAGLPALIAASVGGLWTSMSAIISSLTSGNDMVSQWFVTLDGSVSDFSQFASDAPDIMRLAFYALSIDTLLTYIVSVFAVFVVALVAVLTFFVVAVPSFVIELYAVKLTAWFVSALFPRGFCIQGVTALANMNIYTPVREALKDGKYNPFLGG